MLMGKLVGTDEQFAVTTWTDQGKGHGRREKRIVRVAPPTASTGRAAPRSCASAATPTPPAAPGKAWGTWVPS
jgi:hypothetical protein